jgi:hypothetical protein
MISVSLKIKKRKDNYIGYIFLDKTPIFCFQDKDRDLVYEKMQNKIYQVRCYG